jgi:hypothetical protein
MLKGMSTTLPNRLLSLILGVGGGVWRGIGGALFAGIGFPGVMETEGELAVELVEYVELP